MPKTTFSLKRIFFFSLVFLYQTFLFSQVANNVLWFKGDKGVNSLAGVPATGTTLTTWYDLSGGTAQNGVAATKHPGENAEPPLPTMPTYRYDAGNNNINFNPVVQFVNNVGAGNAVQMSTPALNNQTVFVVFKTAGVGSSQYSTGLLYGGDISDPSGSSATTNSDMSLGVPSTGRLSFGGGSEGDYYNPGDFNLLTLPSIGVLKRNVAGESSVTYSLYANGSTDEAVVNITNTGSGRPLPSMVRLGKHFSADPSNLSSEGKLNGLIAEVLVYDRVLTEVERKTVESYLAIKYGVTITGGTDTLGATAGNVSYSYVNSAGSDVWTSNATYKYDVFGLGRDDLYGLNQRISKSINNNTILTVSTNSDLTSLNLDAARTAINGDKEFMLIANNTGSAALPVQQGTELPSSISTRLNREWKTQLSNTDGSNISNVSLNFNLTGITLTGATASNLVLLIDTDGNGDFTTGTVTRVPVSSFVGSQAVFNNITFNSGDVFTLGVSSCVNPAAPIIGTITQPTCALVTGSVELYGLPTTGTWTINPGGITGTGTTKTITGLVAGNTYSYTVANSGGCVSAASANVVVTSNPALGLDTDGDGISNACDLDDDNDGILDALENDCIPSSSVVIKSSAFENAVVGVGIPKGSFSGVTGTEGFLEGYNSDPDNASSSYSGIFANVAGYNGALTNVALANRTDFGDNLAMSSFVVYKGLNLYDGAKYTVEGDFSLFQSDGSNNNNEFGTALGASGQDFVWADDYVGAPDAVFIYGHSSSDTNNTMAPLIREPNSALSTISVPSRVAGWFHQKTSYYIRPNASGILTLYADNESYRYSVAGVPETSYTANGINFGPASNYPWLSNAAIGVSFDEYTDNIIVSKGTCVTAIDTDGDSIPDYLDLDTDNDGCPDAIEGAANFTGSDLVTSTISGGNVGATSGTYNLPIKSNLGNVVNANGVPTKAGSPQALGDSKNPLVNICCPPTAGAISKDEIICNSGNPAAFTSTTDGTGFGTISYRWESSVSPFSTWNTISGATLATYDAPTGLTATTQYRRITVSTLNGVDCESAAAAFVTVTVNALPVVAAIAGGATTVCVGATTAAFTNTTAGGTWTIANGTGTATINASGVVSGVTAGTVTVEYTVTTSGCSTKVTTPLTINALPVVAAIAGGATTVCVGATTAAFTNTTAGGTWTIANGTGTATINASGVVSGVTAGTVTVEYTVTTSGCSTKVTTPLTINALPAKPTASATLQPTCAVVAGTITITAPTGVGMTYSIDGSTYTNTTGVFNLLAAGTYSVTAKSSEGCVSLASDPIVISNVICAQDDTISGGNGTTGTSNAGNVLGNNPTNPDTLNGTAVVIGLVNLTVTTPAAPKVLGEPVPSIDVATGQVSVPTNTPAGDYTIVYEICEKLNPTNCESATVTVKVEAPTIVAQDDTISGGNGTTGTSNAGNVLGNNPTNPDTLNGTAVVIGLVNLTVTTPAAPKVLGAPVPSIDVATGQVSVPTNTPAGDYTIVYEICEKLNPTNCESATVTLTVTAPTIDAVTETTVVINGLPGGTTATLLANDTVNGNPVVIGTNPGQVTLTSVNVPSRLTLNADGTVTVDPNTPAGNYNVEYKICEVNNPLNCDIVTSIVVVGVAEIIAKNDEITVDNTIKEVKFRPFNSDYGNGFDTLDGKSITFDQITVTVTDIVLPGGQSFPVPKVDSLTKEIVIPASVPAGVYTIFYTICEKLNPTNCSDATITITVKNPVVKAEDDILPTVIGTIGSSNAGNVLEANSTKFDTINGVSATTSLVNISIVSPALPVVNGALVPVLNTTTGNVEVPKNTPAGIYTIAYSICDKINPTVCDEAIVTIKVAAIEAADDGLYEMESLFDKTIASVLLNDTLDGVVLTPETYNTITLTPISVPAGFTLRNDGSIEVKKGMPADTYTIVYEICTKKSPIVCDQATVRITVVAPIITATNDDYSNQPINSSKGAVLDVLVNDRINNGSVNSVQVVVSIVDSNGVAGVSVDAQGKITIPVGTPVGTYVLTYSICDVINPNNCATATVTIVVKDPCDFDDSDSSCDILVHNAFSPNNDGDNQVFTID
uniref:beta strand repeat-containing protein n=1 Tax=Flavobacterium succinicans TaxID=29536 RepID=UPI00054D721F